MAKLKVAPIKDKMRETRQMIFGHVQRRPINSTVGKGDSLKVIGF